MALKAGRVGVAPDQVDPYGKIKGAGYTLPVASADTLGGVKVGTGLTMTDGVLSASGGTTLKTKEVTKSTDYGTGSGSGLYYNSWSYTDLGVAKDKIVSLVKICSDYSKMRDVLLTSSMLVIVSTQQGDSITVRVTYKE